MLPRVLKIPARIVRLTACETVGLDRIEAVSSASELPGSTVEDRNADTAMETRPPSPARKAGRESSMRVSGT